MSEQRTKALHDLLLAAARVLRSAELAAGHAAKAVAAYAAAVEPDKKS